MRTQFGSIHFLTLLSASLAVASGCSDLTAGDAEPNKGPPRLVRALVQDYKYTGGPERASVIDLLDQTPPVACAEDDPCVTQFLLAQTLPDLSCQPDNTCLDPLKLPPSGLMPLNADDTYIRLVFDKPLDPDKIQTIMTDPNGGVVAGQTNSLDAGIVELLDGSGNPVAGTRAFWDNTGSFTYTSDPVLVPFGPALVIVPGTLTASSSYTVRLHPGLLVDERNGKPAVNADGTPLADPTDFKFTVEPLTEGPTVGGELVPNDIAQVGFWEDVDFTTLTGVTWTGPAGFDATKIEAYPDQGSDPTQCAASPTSIDFVYTSAPGVPADWPQGDYTVTFTISPVGGAAPLTIDPLMFTIGGDDSTDPNADPNMYLVHPTPEQCQ